MTEIWRTSTYDDGYEVSNEGRVRSKDRMVAQKASRRTAAYERLLPGRMLSAFISSKTGYLQVSLSHRARFNVHRLIAKGVECMLQIAGVCNGNPETTCMVHLPDETKGWATKSDDTSSTVGCNDCHDVIDNRVKSSLSEEDRLFYMFRGLKRWNKYLLEKGIMTIKGVRL